MKLLREPLLHFLLIGAGLFLLFRVASKDPSQQTGKIVVTSARIEQLAVTFARTWQRQPTAEELEGLIQAFIREEVLYREALALGLDRDDTAIRRRLQQKMEFIAEDVAARAEPTEEEVRDYFLKHPDAFRREQSYSFRHVYLDPKRHGDALQRDAERLLLELDKPGADPAALGDTFLLDYEFKNVNSQDVLGMFGQQFATRLSQLPVGKWQGPVTSAYGAHLVFVEQKTDGSLPNFEEVRESVKRELVNARQTELRDEFYRNLLKRYTVTVERSNPADTEKKVAEIRQ
jgi:parvulin-like peptidyl-prolyl isomerase